MPSNTQIKIRYGMILESCVALALDKAGFRYERAYQYDESSEVPDFLIPNAKTPRILIECHQVGARNSLMMKVLRVLLAVSEAKRHFGSDLVAVSVVFGDLARDFASSPVKALCAAFDCNVLLQSIAGDKSAIKSLERGALRYARDVKIATEKAASHLAKEERDGIAAIARQLNSVLGAASATGGLSAIWKKEVKRKRIRQVDVKAPPRSVWKKALLQSLFLSDEAFEDLCCNGIENIKKNTVAELLSVGVGSVSEQIDGDFIEVDPAFASLLARADAAALRGFARSHLEASKEMRHFFADIREGARREKMAEAFVSAVESGKTCFKKQLVGCASSSGVAGIDHSRCWFADLISLSSGKSFNHFNNLIFRDASYPLTLWCPFSHLVLRTESFIANKDAFEATTDIVVQEFFRLIREDKSAQERLSPHWLGSALLSFRIDNAIKLRKLSPLIAVAAEICGRMGLDIERENLENCLFDVASEAGVGRFLVYVITNPATGERALFNAVAGYENPTDKAKEWAARCLALRYRLKNGNLTEVPWLGSIFLADGEWSMKDILRLKRGGWDEVVGLDDLETVLKSMFKVDAARVKRAPKQVHIFDEDEEELPMAAEED